MEKGREIIDIISLKDCNDENNNSKESHSSYSDVDNTIKQRIQIAATELAFSMGKILASEANTVENRYLNELHQLAEEEGISELLIPSVNLKSNLHSISLESGFSATFSVDAATNIGENQTIPFDIELKIIPRF